MGLGPIEYLQRWRMALAKDQLKSGTRGVGEIASATDSPPCWQRGVDIKTAQELMRHANSRITLEIYQQRVGEEKREAQVRVMGMLLPSNAKGAEGSNPSAPSELYRKQLSKP